MKINGVRALIRKRRLTALYGHAKKRYHLSVTAFMLDQSNNVEDIRSTLRYQAVRSAHLRLREERVFNATLVLILLSYFFSFAAIIAVLSSKAGAFDSGEPRGIAIPIALVCTFAGGYSAMALAVVMMRISLVNGISIVFMTAVVVYFIGMLIVNSTINDFSLAAVFNSSNIAQNLASVAVSAFASAIMATAIIVLGGVAIAVFAIRQPMRRRRPDVAAIDLLIDLMVYLARKPLRFENAETKARVCSMLQAASAYIRDALPQVLNISSGNTNDVLREKLAGSANYLYDLQSATVLAQDETVKQLRDALKEYTLIFIRGEYGSLPAVSATPVARGNRRQLVRIARTVVVALVPIACIVAVRYTGVTLSSEFTGWAVVVAIAWAAITVIAFIDPLYKTRLADVGDLISSVRGKSDSSAE